MPCPLGGEGSAAFQVREIRVRAEASHDLASVHEVLVQAFPSEAEAKLVERLRGHTDPQISLVAENEAGQVVGHILFTPVEISSSSENATAMGLAPMAVLPTFQRQGIGSALVEAGLSACLAAGAPVVVVLGHPSYYPRFGFKLAWDVGLFYESPGANPAFMVQELEPGALRGRSGEVRYHAAFNSV